MNINCEAASTMRSPVSALPPKKIRALPQSFLREQLEKYYQMKPPEPVVERDYTLWECTETGLQFAEPMLPGNAAFYEWVSSFASYYPGVRWEYGEVARVLSAEDFASPHFKVLDVGCGKGDFLRSLDSLPPAKKFALDLNEPAIRACREQGFPAFCGTVESAITSGFLRGGEFPVVTSFHCLEHVGQPVEFVRELLRATAPGGKLFLSTPYSPMSFEQDWFDVLNHPPHHMTRWNLRSYQKLAEILGMKMRHFAPPVNPLKQAWQTFRLKQYGPNRNVSRVKLLLDLGLHFPQFLAERRRLKLRAEQHELGGSDLILVEFTVV
jgi:2-polyprenyl-3-methyl-5-hydroxy-6-metoxy-1,4-benzoquinol methylase